MSEDLVGTNLVSIEKFPHHYWVFHFDEGIRLNVESPWRVVSNNGILLTSEDDGQKFGLTDPVDALVIIRQLLEKHCVTSIEVGTTSSDLLIRFDELLLEIINMSSGYESWTLNCKDGTIVVGRNE